MQRFSSGMKMRAPHFSCKPRGSRRASNPEKRIERRDLRRGASLAKVLLLGLVCSGPASLTLAGGRPPDVTTRTTCRNTEETLCVEDYDRRCCAGRGHRALV